MKAVSCLFLIVRSNIRKSLWLGLAAGLTISVVGMAAQPPPAGGPTLVWSTYLGGSETEEILALTLDGQGNVWGTGVTRSFGDFPTVRGLPSRLPDPNNYHEPPDPLVVRVSSGGEVLLSSLIAGEDSEVPLGIAVFGEEAYLAGFSLESTEFLYIYAARVGPAGGEDYEAREISLEVRTTAEDVVATPDGVWMAGNWNQYDQGERRGAYLARLQPGSLDVAEAVLHEDMPFLQELAADPSGHLYVAGILYGSGELNANLWIARLSPDGTRVLSSVAVGGRGYEVPTDLAVDSGGNAWVAGYTRSTDFPLVRPVQAELRGDEDAFLLKLDPEGRILFSTYLGGAGVDRAEGLALDGGGGVYLAGSTSSGDFPVTGALPRSCGTGLCGAADAFAARIAPAALAWSVLLGGSEEETGRSVVSLGQGRIVVGGATSSADFPTRNAFQPSRRGFTDAFLTRLDASNRPPDCSGATASPPVIWPPDGKMVPVSILGVTDPDGDPATIEITGIAHDEPGAGSASSGIGSSTARVKAERDGKGDGRVYRILFDARDPSGASCAGEVTVCVPHDKRSGCADSFSGSSGAWQMPS